MRKATSIMAILVALAVTMGGAWWWYSQRDTPQKAVKAYLTALAQRDANRALGYADRGVDATFLTREVLDSLAETDSGVSGVGVVDGARATFTVAGREHTVTYPMQQVQGTYRLPAAVEVAFSSSVPLQLMGRKVTGKTYLFPGRYTVTSASPQIAVEHEFTAVDPNAVLRVIPEVKLTAQGLAAARQAASDELKRCLNAKQLAPTNCPFQLKQPPNGTIDETTITYTLEGADPLADGDFVWDAPTASAKLSARMVITLKATGPMKAGGGQGEVSQEMTLNPTVYVDVLNEQMKVTWG